MAMTLARRLRSPLALAGSAAIGGRVWHAPLPTRYRFAIQGASIKVLLKPNEDLGAEWTASAWAWAPVSTSASATSATTTHPPVWSGGPGEEAMWKAMLDIRKFAERVDKNSLVLSSQIQQLFKLVESIQQSIQQNRSWKGWKYVFGVLATAGVFLSNYLNGKFIIKSAVHEYLVTTVNEVVTDPETQHNLKMSGRVIADAAGERLNPVSRIKGLFVGEVEEEELLSYSDLVAKDVFLCIEILRIVLLDTRRGTTFDHIMQDLNLVRKESPVRVMEMLQFLQSQGYVDEENEKENKKTYSPSFTLIWVCDSDSGGLEKRLRAMLRMKRTTKQDDRKSSEVDTMNKDEDKIDGIGKK